MDLIDRQKLEEERKELTKSIVDLARHRIKENDDLLCLLIFKVDGLNQKIDREEPNTDRQKLEEERKELSKLIVRLIIHRIKDDDPLRLLISKVHDLNQKIDGHSYLDPIDLVT